MILRVGVVVGRFDVAVKRLVWERDGGHCVRCGVAVWEGDVHHRRPRGMGTALRAWWANDHSNLLLLCRGCHAWIEGHREVSLDRGWLVPEGVEPWEVPVCYYDGVVYRLHDEDYRTPVGVHRRDW